MYVCIMMKLVNLRYAEPEGYFNSFPTSIGISVHKFLSIIFLLLFDIELNCSQARPSRKFTQKLLSNLGIRSNNQTFNTQTFIGKIHFLN